MKIEDWLGADNRIGIDIWNRKYRHNDESFEGWLNRVSGGDNDIKQLMIDKKFLYAGRILANRGLQKEGLNITYSNCYVVSSPEDNIESIFETAGKIARTFSYGGGVGIDLSKLAPRGAKVRNTASKTSGAVSFTDLYSMVTELIGQHGRRGALMLTMSCDHPDLEEFMRVKTDLERVTKANMSIRVTDRFMEAVRDRKTYTQQFLRPETGELITKDLDAYSFFMDMCKANWDYGEPACLFWDRVEDYSLMSKHPEYKVECTNPCVTGDTKILTDKGYVRIDSVTDTDVNVWNGEEYSTVRPRITGHNKEIINLEFSNGMRLSCTPNHKFILTDGTRVTAEDLTPDHKLVRWYFPIIESENPDLKNEKQMYTQGFFAGDGCIYKSETKHRIYFYTRKLDLIELMDYTNKWEEDSRTVVCIDSNIYPEKFMVPDISYSINDRLKWLAGILDSDGTLNSEDGALAITSTRRWFLEDIQYMLATLGCQSCIDEGREGGRQIFPCGGTYDYNPTNRLTISAFNTKKLMDLGLKTNRVKLVANPNRDASRFIRLRSKEYRRELEENVYCFTEPNRHAGIFNGILTGNCGEQPLPAGGSCLLGSLNLSAFVKDGQFDYEDFERAVKIAVIGLNEVLDEGLELHPLKEQRDAVRNWRQIGLGIMGLADMLVKLGIEYGSKASLDFSENLARKLISIALNTSSELAKEMGAFPKCDIDAILDSAFMENPAWGTHLNIRENGLRNSHLLTIAPTGSISTMLGISGGIEPIFANSYQRRTVSLSDQEETYQVYTPVIKDLMDSEGYTEDNLPDYCVTARDIDYRKRIDMQAVWQKYIDASISSTVNLPATATPEDIYDLYMYAWEKGCKGITVFREGCQRDSILTTSTEEPDPTALVGKKRKLITGCGNLHCTAFFDPTDGRLQEVYLNKGSTGGCNNFMIGLSRMMSLSARNGVDIHSIVDQLKSCGSCPSYTVRKATQKDTSKGSSCPVAVGYALVDMWKDMQAEVGNEPIERKVKSVNPCPVCDAELESQGGCMVCIACGWTRCD